MNMIAVTELFNKIYETGALIIQPAKLFEIDRCNNDLKSIGVAPLPAEYIEFLREVANGLAWNGFEFFGTYKVTVKKSGFVLKDIVYFNQYYHESKYGLKDMIVLGRFDDDMYVYNTVDKVYQSLDRLTLMEIETYETFEDLLLLTVGEYAYYDDDDDYEEDDDDFEEDDEESCPDGDSDDYEYPPDDENDFSRFADD